MILNAAAALTVRASSESTFPALLQRQIDGFRAADQSGRALSLPPPIIDDWNRTFDSEPQGRAVMRHPLGPSEEERMEGLRGFLDDWPFEFLTPDSEVARAITLLPMRPECYSEEVRGNCVIILESDDEHFERKCAAAICTHEEWAPTRAAIRASSVANEHRSSPQSMPSCLRVYSG